MKEYRDADRALGFDRIAETLSGCMMNTRHDVVSVLVKRPVPVADLEVLRVLEHEAAC